MAFSCVVTQMAAGVGQPFVVLGIVLMVSIHVMDCDTAGDWTALTVSILSVGFVIHERFVAKATALVPNQESNKLSTLTQFLSGGFSH